MTPLEEQQNAADEARRQEANIRILEKVPNHMRVQIMVIEPGLSHPVFRICSKQLALELVKDRAAYYIRADDGSNSVFFDRIDVSKTLERLGDELCSDY